MKEMQLLRAIGTVDDKLVEAAADAKVGGPRLRLVVTRWAAIAACLALAVGIGITTLNKVPQLVPEIQMAAPTAEGRVATMESPAGPRRMFNYGGYRYEFVGDAIPYDFSAFHLINTLGTLDHDILGVIDGNAESDVAEMDFATTYALGGTVYEIPGYDPAYRLAVDFNGQTFLAQVVGRVDNTPLGAEYFFTVSDLEKRTAGADILPHMGGESLSQIKKRDAKNMVGILSGAVEARLENEDYEAIAGAQAEGRSWRLALHLNDGTQVEFYIQPEQGVISIGDDYYTLPEAFLTEYGGLFEGLQQDPPPLS